MGTGLGNDTYKIRLAVKSKCKGKSGGVRIIDVYSQKKLRLFISDILFAGIFFYGRNAPF
jgi:hypothetical protein